MNIKETFYLNKHLMLTRKLTYLYMIWRVSPIYPRGEVRH